MWSSNLVVLPIDLYLQGKKSGEVDSYIFYALLGGLVIRDDRDEHEIARGDNVVHIIPCFFWWEPFSGTLSQL